MDNRGVRLNAIGRAAMNQPLRVLAQRRYVAPRWERMGGRIDEGQALEVGCGRGVGLAVILERFGPRCVRGIDVDPVMVEKARARWPPTDFPWVQVDLGDATHIEAADRSFDGVFDFGAIHLVPDWRAALAEVRRVLAPNGRFYFEEIAGPLYRGVLPLFTEGFRDAKANGFAAAPFLAELARLGMSVGSNVHTPRVAQLTGVIGDLIGVARVGEG